jgi:hypothetical protein
LSKPANKLNPLHFRAQPLGDAVQNAFRITIEKADYRRFQSLFDLIEGWPEGEILKTARF